MSPRAAGLGPALLLCTSIASCAASTSEAPAVAVAPGAASSDGPPSVSAAAATPRAADRAHAPAPVVDAGPAAPLERSMTDDERRRAISFPEAPRHRSSVLAGPARPSKLKPGNYACRTGAEYRLRPCAAYKDDAGFTWLEMPSSLIGFKAVAYDEGASLVLEGTSMDERPFGCFGCDERCTLEPGTCACQEMLPAGSRECLAQPSVVKLTASGGGWRGTLEYGSYFNRYEGAGAERHVAGWTREVVKLLVEVVPANRAAPPATGSKR